MKIVYFQFAGNFGNDGFYNSLLNYFPSCDIMLVNNYYSYQKYFAPIDEIFIKIKDFISDDNYIMISCSMGALLLYECCYKIYLNNIYLPEKVFIISLTSPLYIEEIKQNEEQCISSIYNISDPRMFKIIKKLVIRDFSLAKKIDYHSCKLEIEASVFYASDDIMTYDIKSWDNYFSKITYYELNGDHFIFITYAGMIIEEIRKQLL